MKRILLYCVLSSVWWAAGEPCAASWDDFVKRPTLTGSWGGWRDPLADYGLTSEFVYTADVFSTVRGGKRRGTRYLDNFDLTVTYDPAEMGGWDLGRFFVYGLANHGEDPSRDVGDAQGVDNIAAPQSIKLYEAWWQNAIFDDRASFLIGLYDLNSEFDVIESATVLINGSFGIGPEFGQSGVNGASNFPFTSVGARLKVSPLDQLAFQLVVLDGVPGDPSNPKGTHIDIDEDDGLLVVAELDYFVYGEGYQNRTSMQRRRRRRIGRGWGELSYVLKLAIGTWAYSKNLDRIDQSRSGGPIDEQAQPGAYVLADWDAYSEDPLSLQGLSVFARLGFADDDVQQFAGYAGGGLVYTGPIPGRDEDRAGIGVAAARNGEPFRRNAGTTGQRPARWEVAIEATYRAQLTGWLSVQPDVQLVIDPTFDPGRDDAVVVGLRSEIAF
jgi:porin